ncbi:winged helix-turn-helix transcriptional regulator (plasmid) [Bacillus mycoides]|nr:winged helix-turn-helix transcriptional regulator [Bacillus mycoides]
MSSIINKELKVCEEKVKFLKVLAHPTRLCIVNRLIQNGLSNVSTIHKALNMPQSTISQHLSKLKAAEIVISERKGVEIYYKVKKKINDSVSKYITRIWKLTDWFGCKVCKNHKQVDK